MIPMIKLHAAYLFSQKVIYISYGVVLISMIGFLLFSNFYVSEEVLTIYKKDYFLDYLFDGINFLKIIGLFYGLFLVINGYILHKYDVFLFTRVPKIKAIISKLFVLLIGNTVYISTCFMIFLIIPLYLTPYFDISRNYASIFLELVLFETYYILLFVLVVQVFKNMYALLMVLIGYFVANLSTEFFLLKDEMSGFSKLINAVFIDIGYFKHLDFDFLYGNTYSLILISIVFLIYIKSANESDIYI